MYIILIIKADGVSFELKTDRCVFIYFFPKTEEIGGLVSTAGMKRMWNGVSSLLIKS